jgi:SAM-dependent methyltransferase
VEPELIDMMIEVDALHWWYRGRRRVIAATLDGLSLRPDARILDAGCGSGVELDQLRAYGSVAGVDVSPEAVAAARARGHDVRIEDVQRLPWEDGWFDLVTCLDVLEHTPDDCATLGELRRVTRAKGHALITVPAHPALWSAYDEACHHYRRYGRATISRAAVAAGWRILGPAAAVRFAQRLRSNNHSHSYMQLPPPLLNRLLELPNRAEAAWLRRGRSIPFGLSLLALLRKAD